MAPDERILKRLQSCFDHARKVMAQEDCNRDYVNDLLTQCVIGDPANVDYMQTFWENLCKKFHNKKGNKLVQLSGMAGRGAMKKAIDKKDWAAATKQAVELLKKDPFDTGVLSGLATIAELNDYGDVELRWLKAALVSSVNDPDVNRQCALALARRNQFDQAIVCWHRVEKARPNDDEPPREIANLAMQKTRAQGGYHETGSNASGHKAKERDEAEESPEEQFKRQIEKDPKALKPYLDLGQLYVTYERYPEAVKVLERAVKISNNDLEVVERLDEVQLVMLKQRLNAAEKKAKASRSEADVQEYNTILQEFRAHDVKVHEERCQRSPTNFAFKYELGVRYQQNKQYGEAIKQFQGSLSDPRQRGLCLLAMGECFQQIKQPRLAMGNYVQAIEAIPDRDVANKKLAIYRAGRLALLIKDVETAEKHLTTLAQLDFGYRDVSELLEKLEQLRSNAPPNGDVKDE